MSVFTDRIKEKLKSLGVDGVDFVDLKKAKKDTIYRLIAKTNSGEKIMFKAPLGDKRQLVDYLKNDIFILENLDNIESKLLRSPKIIKKGVYKKYAWYAQEYLEGKPLGSWQTGFDKEVLKNTDIAKKMARSVYFLQVNLLSVVDDKHFKQRKSESVKKETTELIKKITALKIINRPLSERLLGLLNLKTDKETFVLGHGNITPEKIIKLEGVLGFIGWKGAAISNPAMDLASIWAYASLNTQWRKVFMEEYMHLSSNQLIVESFMNTEKIRALMGILNRFVEESNFKTIKNGKKRFFNSIIKDLKNIK